ncbi:class I SAM-dependent methyltransferase [Aeromicrobium sp.]
MSENPQNAEYSLPSRSLRTLPGRSLKSLRSRGIRSTLRIIRSHAGSALFDLRYGVHTDQWVNLDELELVGDNRDKGNAYQPIRPLMFRSAMDSFRIPRDGVFVDFGSGKGRVLLLAILYGFHRAVGVEFARELCHDAEHNLDKFRKRTGKDFEARVLDLDAAAYQVDDDDCVFFLFNPFGRDVLEQVLSNIRQSLASKPRPIHVVYANPVHRQVLDDDPFWRTVEETTSGGIETFVYYQPR